MATAKIVLSYSVSSSSADKVTIKITMKYYGNGVSWSNNACTGKITFHGSPKTFTHTFSTSTSAQTMGSASFTVSRTHSKQTLTAKGTFATGVSIGTLSDTLSVTINPKTSYTVSYYGKGYTGGTVPGDQTKWYGESLTLSTAKPTKSGYSFKGWDTSNTGTTVRYSPGGTYNSNSDLKLFAVWESSSCTLTMNANGGTITARSGYWTGSGTKATKTITSGNSYGTLPDSSYISRSGYTFDNWWTSSTTGSQVSSATTISKSTTIYAHWYSTLTFNANGHGTAPSNVIMRYATSVNLPTMLASGYSFKGWNTSADGSGTTYPGQYKYKSANTAPTANKTLYAQWTTNYVSPSISGLSVQRVVRHESQYTPSTGGDLLSVQFSWSAAQAGGNVYPTSILVEVFDEEYPSGFTVYETSSTSSSGSEIIVPIRDSNSEDYICSIGKTPKIVVTITDTSSGEDDAITTDEVTADAGGFLIHIHPSENSIALFGIAQEGDDGLIVNKPTKINSNTNISGTLTLMDHDSRVGYVKSIGSPESYYRDITRTSSGWTVYSDYILTLSPGTWMIKTYIRLTGLTASKQYGGCMYYRSVGNTGWTRLQTTRIMSHSSSTNGLSFVTTYIGNITTPKEYCIGVYSLANAAGYINASSSSSRDANSIYMCAVRIA